MTSKKRKAPTESVSFREATSHYEKKQKHEISSFYKKNVSLRLKENRDEIKRLQAEVDSVHQQRHDAGVEAGAIQQMWDQLDTDLVTMVARFASSETASSDPEPPASSDPSTSSLSPTPPPSASLFALATFALDPASLADPGSEDERDEGEDADGDTDMKDAGASGASSSSSSRPPPSLNRRQSRSARDAPLPTPLYDSDLNHVRRRHTSAPTKVALRSRAERTKRLVESLVRGIDSCASEYRRLSSALSAAESTPGGLGEANRTLLKEKQALEASLVELQKVVTEKSKLVASYTQKLSSALSRIKSLLTDRESLKDALHKARRHKHRARIGGGAPTLVAAAAAAGLMHRQMSAPNLTAMSSAAHAMTDDPSGSSKYCPSAPKTPEKFTPPTSTDPSSTASQTPRPRGGPASGAAPGVLSTTPGVESKSPTTPPDGGPVDQAEAAADLDYYRALARDRAAESDAHQRRAADLDAEVKRLEEALCHLRGQCKGLTQQVEEFSSMTERMEEAAARATKKHAEEMAALTQANKRAYSDFTSRRQKYEQQIQAHEKELDSLRAAKQQVALERDQLRKLDNRDLLREQKTMLETRDGEVKRLRTQLGLLEGTRDAEEVIKMMAAGARLADLVPHLAPPSSAAGGVAPTSSSTSSSSSSSSGSPKGMNGVAANHNGASASTSSSSSSSPDIGGNKQAPPTLPSRADDTRTAFLEDEIRRLKRDKLDLKDMVDTLKSNDKEKRTITLLRFAEKKLVHERAELVKAKAALQAKLDAVSESKLMAERDSTKNVNKILMESLDQAEKDMQAHNAQRERIQAKFEHREQEVASLIEERVKRNHDQSTAKEDLAAARKRLKTVEANYEHEKKRCRVAEKSLHERKNELHAAQAKVRELTAKCDTLSHDLQRATSDLACSEQKHAEVSASYTKLREQHRTTQAALDKKATACTRLQEETRKLSARVQRLTKSSHSAPVNRAQEEELRAAEHELAKIKEKLTCSICSKNPKDTVLTACHHTFCQTCVDNLWAVRNRSCPQCNESIKHKGWAPVFLQ